MAKTNNAVKPVEKEKVESVVVEKEIVKKMTVIFNCNYSDKVLYRIGASAEFDEKEALHLIEMGVAKKCQ